MAYQDIQLTDESLRTQYVNYWITDNYTSALALLQNSQFTDKVNNATMWNSITTDLTNVENLSDPTFKSDRIQVASTPPTLTSGEVYFQIL
jgi:hypothetical protein